MRKHFERAASASMDSASARARGSTPAWANAAMMASDAAPAARRLLDRVFRFCANALRTKPRNMFGSTSSSAKRGAKRQRKTVEYTSGGGEKDEGGRVKRDRKSTRLNSS